MEEKALKCNSLRGEGGKRTKRGWRRRRGPLQKEFPSRSGLQCPPNSHAGVPSSVLEIITENTRGGPAACQLPLTRTLQVDAAVIFILELRNKKRIRQTGTCSKSQSLSMMEEVFESRQMCSDTCASPGWRREAALGLVVYDVASGLEVDLQEQRGRDCLFCTPPRPPKLELPGLCSTSLISMYF